ncbi:hypothetical protein EBR04_07260 [bacterium]|nr:hypothetical protein [bacterium]
MAGNSPAPSRRYERRRPEKTPLHTIISENLESWLAWREAAERPVPGYVEEELRGYLECGLLCFGFARAVCMTCRTGFVVAFSCKGRGVCPSCNGRHMAQTAAHLADHVIPPVPVRQWVISVPERLRGFLADRPRAVAAVTRIFLDEIERTLITASGVTAAADTPSASRPRLGGISFLHRFGSALNHHVHLHACVTDGVFVPAADDAGCDAPPAFAPARPFPPVDGGRERACGGMHAAALTPRDAGTPAAASLLGIIPAAGDADKGGRIRGVGGFHDPFADWWQPCWR